MIIVQRLIKLNSNLFEIIFIENKIENNNLFEFIFHKFNFQNNLIQVINLVFNFINKILIILFQNIN